MFQKSRNSASSISSPVCRRMVWLKASRYAGSECASVPSKSKMKQLKDIAVSGSKANPKSDCNCVYRRHDLECGDLSPLCIISLVQSGDQSPHSKACGCHAYCTSLIENFAVSTSAPSRGCLFSPSRVGGILTAPPFTQPSSQAGGLR